VSDDKGGLCWTARSPLDANQRFETCHPPSETPLARPRVQAPSSYVRARSVRCPRPMIAADQSGGEKAAAKTIAGHLADFKNRQRQPGMSIAAFFSIQLPCLSKTIMWENACSPHHIENSCSKAEEQKEDRSPRNRSASPSQHILGLLRPAPSRRAESTGDGR